MCCRIQNKPEKSTKTANKKDDEELIVNPLLQATEEEARVDEGEEEPGEGEGEEEAMPVPQVKIGPDGSLIINEERSAILKTLVLLAFKFTSNIKSNKSVSQ